MARFRKSLLILILFAAMLAWSGTVCAEQLELRNLVLDNEKGGIQLRFGIIVDEEELLKEYLQEDGYTLRLRCRAQLLKTRTLWWDEGLAENEIVFELSCNQLSQQYTLRNLGGGEKATAEDLGNMLRKQWHHLTIRLGEWRNLTKRESYAVELDVTLRRANVPMWLRKALFFWSWDVVSSRRYRMDFTY
jgi:hypothetical protein